MSVNRHSHTVTVSSCFGSENLLDWIYMVSKAMPEKWFWVKILLSVLNQRYVAPIGLSMHTKILMITTKIGFWFFKKMVSKD